jgi:hypothetical protein
MAEESDVQTKEQPKTASSILARVSALAVATIFIMIGIDMINMSVSAASPQDRMWASLAIFLALALVSEASRKAS